MQKVISINLNGNAYQVEEAGYDALITYLDSAHRQLRENPDRVEIVADLEQAIAEKCQRYLGPHKTVVSAGEVDQLLQEMGPVDAGDAGAPKKPSAPRRLYRIPDGAMIAGICNGIAAYAGIDPVIVRVVFVVLLLITQGVFALAYFLLAIILPQANTAEERAAAYGERFSARDLIDRAKREYAKYAGATDSTSSWKRERREWKRRRRMARRARWNPAAGPAPIPASYTARVFAGLTLPLLTLVGVGLFWVWLTVLFSLVTRQELLGRPLPEDLPLWIAVLGVILVYQAVSWPLHAARRWLYHLTAGPYGSPVAVLDGLVSAGVVVVTIWVAFRYLPEVREFLQALPDVVRSVRDSFAT
ncbi:MAG TPA: PspC domain-containing protein [Vicinamibacterales bacterium]|nr:PspC domain-containing protein [Vicinamibacterales bacterium]